MSETHNNWPSEMAIQPRVKTPHEILAAWQTAKNSLDHYKELERVCRADVINAFFNGEVKKGTNALDLGQGWTLKATGKLNFSVENTPMLNTYLAQLTNLAPVAATLANEIIRWNPECNVKAFEALQRAAALASSTDNIAVEMFKIVTSFVTVKPATPSIELIPPKPAEQ